MAYEVRVDVTQTGIESVQKSTVEMSLLKEQVRLTGAEMRQSANRIVDAQKQMAEAVSAGHTVVADTLAVVLAKERAELDSLIAKQRELKSSLDELTPSTVKATAAATTQTVATAKLTEAHVRMVPAVAAANAELRILQGNLSTRAVGQFATNVLGLGPILQKAFPVFGALALGEVVVGLGEKIYALVEKWNLVAQAEKRAKDAATEYGNSVDAARRVAREDQNENFRRRNGGAAANANESAQLAEDKAAVDRRLKAAETVRDQAARTMASERTRILADNDRFTEQQIESRSPLYTTSKAQYKIQNANIAELQQQSDHLGYLSQFKAEDSAKAQHEANEAAARDAEAAARKAKEDARPGQELKKRQDDNFTKAQTQLSELQAKEVPGVEGILAKREAIYDALAKSKDVSRAQLEIEKQITAELVRQYNAKLDAGAGDIAIVAGEQREKNRERNRRESIADLNDSRDPHEFDDYNRAQQVRELKDKGSDINATGAAQAARLQVQRAAAVNTDPSKRIALAIWEQTQLAQIDADEAKERIAAEQKVLADIERERGRETPEYQAQANRILEITNETNDRRIAAETKVIETISSARESDLRKYQQLSGEVFGALINRQLGAGRALAQLLRSGVETQASQVFQNLTAGILQTAGHGLASIVPAASALRGTVLDPANRGIGSTQTSTGNPANKSVNPTQTAIGDLSNKGVNPTQSAIEAHTAIAVEYLKHIDQTLSGDPSASSSAPAGVSPSSGSSEGLLSNPLNAIARMISLPPELSAGASIVASSIGSPSNVLGSISKILGAGTTGIASVFRGNALSNVLGVSTPGVTVTGAATLAGGLPNPLAGTSVSLPGYTPTTMERVGSGVGLATTLGAGALGIISGIHTGGASGALTAAGSAAGAAGAIVGNVASLMKATGPLLSAIPIVGSIAALALPLIGSFFGTGPAKRATEISQEIAKNQYIAPQALNVTQSSNGNFVDFDARGNLRTSNFSAVPTVSQGFVWEQTHGLFGPPPTYYDVPGGQTSQFGAPVTVVNHNYGPGSIQALDAPSVHALLQKNSASVASAAGKGLQDGHATLTAEVQRLARG